MTPTVKAPAAAPRTRRAEQAERTRRRILEAATALFTDLGYGTTTIESIAARADVAVETIYGRFRSKANLLDAILGPAITGRDDGRTLFEQPEFLEIRSATDQRQQVRLMAHLSRTILERTDQIHRILRTAASSDPNAAELQRLDTDRRRRSQAVYIDLLAVNGPLRHGLTHSEAADTYTALANPATYSFLTGDRDWSPDRFEEWLADSSARLLLP